ncbi:uncharacterized protein LOC130988329 isoform X1 [Salvia miltiorrhiza]|uniref:uncharacterized protein LOC130988329 isoform X1 n=1 Tax=Salvia miltiorrhiza TaxID=226208 RepID=UPI0025AB70C4|nr:uncharacterized protein LOC130988329 isoform X1 [Salvia miltiorrhiza]
MTNFVSIRFSLLPKKLKKGNIPCVSKLLLLFKGVTRLFQWHEFQQWRSTSAFVSLSLGVFDRNLGDRLIRDRSSSSIIARSQIPHLLDTTDWPSLRSTFF